MLKKKYQKWVKDILEESIRDDSVKFFIFGSSAQDEIYHDIDVGLYGDDVIPMNTLVKLSEKFEESMIPYKVDIVDFNNVDEIFRDKILNEEPKIWLT